MTLMLGGCASFGQYPVDPGLKACIEATVPVPVGQSLSQKRLFTLVADLKQSETEKVFCGRRLIQLVEQK